MLWVVRCPGGRRLRLLLHEGRARWKRRLRGGLERRLLGQLPLLLLLLRQLRLPRRCACRGTLLRLLLPLLLRLLHLPLHLSLRLRLRLCLSLMLRLVHMHMRLLVLHLHMLRLLVELLLLLLEQELVLLELVLLVKLLLKHLLRAHVLHEVLWRGGGHRQGQGGRRRYDRGGDRLQHGVRRAVGCLGGSRVGVQSDGRAA